MVELFMREQGVYEVERRSHRPVQDVRIIMSGALDQRASLTQHHEEI